MELYKKRGTKQLLSFLQRVIRNVGRCINRRRGSKVVLVKLNAFEEDEQELLVAQDVIQRYLKGFIPINLSH